MVIKLCNASKTDLIISATDQNSSTQKYRLVPNEEKRIIVDTDQININILHNYLSKSKINTTLVADLNLIINNSYENENQITIYSSQKFTEKCRFIVDFFYVETDLDVLFEEHYINNIDDVRNKILNSFKKEKKVNKHLNRIWPLIFMMGGSTFVLRQITDGFLFVILLAIDYILIFLLNKAVDKLFKIDKGIDDERRAKIDTFNKLCESSYLSEFIKTP